MSKIEKDTVLDVVTCFYLDSRDFNGISASGLTDELGVIWDDLHKVSLLLVFGLCAPFLQTFQFLLY